MPESFSQLVQDVVSSYIEFRQDRDKLDSLGKAVAALLDQLVKVKRAVADEEGIDVIDGILTIQEGTDLSNFFQQVGEALIKGQTNLDERSILYNRLNAA